MSVFNGVLLMCPVLCPNIYTICLFNFFSGVISCLRYPWVNSYVPLLVEKEELVDANAAVSFSKTSGQLIMPLLSGILFVAASSTVLFLLNIVFLVFAVISFWRLPESSDSVQAGEEENVDLSMFQVLQSILLDKRISAVALLMMLILFLDGGTDLLLIMVAKEVFYISDFYYGVLTTIQGLGMTLASIGALKWIMKLKFNDLKLLYFLGFLKIVLIFLLGYAVYFPIFLLIVFCEAYFWIAMTILEKNLIQTGILPSHRALIFAVYGSLCWLASSMGTLVFGYLTEILSISSAVTIEAAGILIAVIILKNRMNLYWNEK